MDPDNIKLSNLSKMFAYSQLASEIDSCDDSDTLKKIAKSFCKLYYKQQETMSIIGIPLLIQMPVCQRVLTLLCIPEQIFTQTLTLLILQTLHLILRDIQDPLRCQKVWLLGQHLE